MQHGCEPGVIVAIDGTDERVCKIGAYGQYAQHVTDFINHNSPPGTGEFTGSLLQRCMYNGHYGHNGFHLQHGVQANGMRVVFGSVLRHHDQTVLSRSNLTAQLAVVVLEGGVTAKAATDSAYKRGPVLKFICVLYFPFLVARQSTTQAVRKQ
jgi:hypothetical protein